MKQTILPRVRPTGSAASIERTFKHNGKKIITRKGCMVNFHGVFFFADATITKRNPWKLTLKHGILPNIQEWTRLQTEHSLKVVALTDAEETCATVIANSLCDLKRGLTRREYIAYIRRNDTQKRRVGPAMKTAYVDRTNRQYPKLGIPLKKVN